MKNQIILIAFLFLSIGLQAQDFLFTQFHLSPMNLNPALAGGADNYRFAINYRENTAGLNSVGGISLDAPFLLSEYDKIGIGARAAFDRIGTLDLTYSKFSVLLSYQRRLFKNSERIHLLSIGLDGGFGQSSINLTNAVSPSPIQGGGVSSSYPDFNSGISYQLKFNPDTKFLIGASLSHLFEPNASLDGFLNVFLARSFLMHAEVDISIAQNMWITPRVLSWKRDDIQLFTGLMSVKYRRNTRLFELGIGFKTNSQSDKNNLVFLGAFEYKDFKFGVSRDLNTSAVRSLVGDAYEGSLIYEF